jgi:hypothetical protein
MAGGFGFLFVRRTAPIAAKEGVGPSFLESSLRDDGGRKCRSPISAGIPPSRLTPANIGLPAFFWRTGNLSDGVSFEGLFSSFPSFRVHHRWATPAQSGGCYPLGGVGGVKHQGGSRGSQGGSRGDRTRVAGGG